MNTIFFHKENISFRLRNIGKLKNWIKQTILNENKQLGELNIIFCSDDYLHKINVAYLNHNTLTDIITFDYSKNTIISGDIFISRERIKENAYFFNQRIDNETNRVIIHGVLHLIGYKDKTKNDKIIMKNKEDFYLNLF